MADLMIPLVEVRKLHIDYAEQVFLDETTGYAKYALEPAQFRERLRLRLTNAFADRRFTKRFRPKRELGKIVGRTAQRYKAALKKQRIEARRACARRARARKRGRE
jgi:hypothetical protein